MVTLEKLKAQKILPALTVAVGLVLMAGKIYADSNRARSRYCWSCSVRGGISSREPGLSRVAGNLPGGGRRDRVR